MTKQERKTCLKLLRLFQIDGKRADTQVTEGQLEIFYSLVFRPRSREIILCSTQYGKSLITALACIVITCIQNEVVAVVAPTNEKAKIIMRYFIDHLGDSILFYDQLEADTKLERLRKEESKERITFQNGGGIFVVSVQTGNSRKTVEAAMGLGSKIVIQDESCLIPDDTESTIFRMIAGKGEEAFYCKIGNPFYRMPPYTHFWDSWNDDAYYKIKIDYTQALKENRYNEKFINEARKKPNFDILFACEFPPPDIMDTKGWMPLFVPSEIELAMEGTEDMEVIGEKGLGIDIADSGTNESVIVKRGQNLAEIVFASSEIDLMQFAGQCVITVDEEKVNAGNVFADIIGVGAGLVGRVREQRQPIQGINVAEQAGDRRRFYNLRAEGYWNLRQWVKQGGKLKRDERWYQLTNIKYRAEDSSGRVKIMSKLEMHKEGIPSPDVADALMLTFTRPYIVRGPEFEEQWFRRKMRDKKLVK